MKEALFIKQEGDPKRQDALLEVNILRELFEKVYFDKRLGNQKSMPIKAVQPAYLKMKDAISKMERLSSEDRQMIHDVAVEIEECCLQVEISYIRLAKLLGTLETLRDFLSFAHLEKSGFKVKVLLTLNILRQLIRDKEEMKTPEDRLEWLKQAQELATFLDFYSSKLKLNAEQELILKKVQEKFDILKSHINGGELAFLAGLIDTFHDLL